MKIIFLSLLFFLNLCLLHSKENGKKYTFYLTAKLKDENDNHAPFLDIINKAFSNLRNDYINYYENEDYRCSFNMLDYVIYNNSIEIKKLFVNGNEELVRDAAYELNSKVLDSFTFTLKKLSQFDLKKGQCAYVTKFFEELRITLYKLDSSNAEHINISDFPYLKLFDVNSQNMNSLISLVKSFVYNDTTNNKNLRNGFPHLPKNSENTNDAENDKKENIVSSEELKEKLTKNSENANDAENDKKENIVSSEELKEKLTPKDKAFNTLLKNSFFLVDASCTSKSKTPNQGFISFQSQFNNDILSTSCNTSNSSSHISNYDTSNKITLNKNLINEKQLRDNISILCKLINNAHFNNQLLNKPIQSMCSITKNSNTDD